MSFVSLLAAPLIAASSLISGADLASSVVSAIDGRPDAEAVREALIVRLTNLNAPTMFSQRAVDTLDGADASKRLSYTVAPFSPVTGGGGCVVIAQDEAGETYVLLGRKTDKEEWILPSGFMNPISASSPLGVYTKDTEEREPYEVSHMKGRSTSGKHIQQLTDAAPKFDGSLLTTALRETSEETGLALRPDQLELVENLTDTGVRSSPHGQQTYQQITNFYLADIRAQKSLPAVMPHDDLEALAWIKIKDMRPSPLFPPVVEKAIALMRGKELSAQGVTKEAVAAYMEKSGQPKPPTEFGNEAFEWHEKALHAARTMGWTLAQMKPQQPQGQSL